MTNDHYLIKALYDFEATDAKTLNCTLGELFIIIKPSKPEIDWLYVVNCSGKLGYVPANYVTPEKLDDQLFLSLIDSVISVLDTNHNDCQIITIRQINHAQIKLAQLRCEIVNRICAASSPSPETMFAKAVDEKTSPYRIQEESSIKEVKKPICKSDTSSQTCFSPKKLQNVEVQTEKCIEKMESDDNLLDPSIYNNIVLDLIERIRVSTELSHNMCKFTIESVIKFLAEKFPICRKTFTSLINQLHSIDKCSSPLMQNSSDLIKLRDIFQKLWRCKNDEQQRSWPIQEDELFIKDHLSLLVKLLSNANPNICREVILDSNCENISMLVTYFQMETRKSLKMELYKILNQIAYLYEDVIEDTYLCSVLPLALANEMINYKDDLERWSNASTLFTLVFCSGHKPPINIYEHLNKSFISQLFDLVEDEDSDGNKIGSLIPPEKSIPPILSFNLHMETSFNLVLDALRMRKNANRLIESLISYLNWDEDPTFPGVFNIQKKFQRKNAVHKLLLEIFGDRHLVKLFYHNDVRVVIDVVVTYLNNLIPGDESRINYLCLAENIIKNTMYKDEPHKLNEVVKCLESIKFHEMSTVPEREIATDITNYLKL